MGNTVGSIQGSIWETFQWSSGGIQDALPAPAQPRPQPPPKPAASPGPGRRSRGAGQLRVQGVQDALLAGRARLRRLRSTGSGPAPPPLARLRPPVSALGSGSWAPGAPGLWALGSGLLGSGLRALSSGLLGSWARGSWAMGSGLLGTGLWALGSGLWAPGLWAPGLWALGSRALGSWALGSGLWALGSGLWAPGLWALGSGLRALSFSSCDLCAAGGGPARLRGEFVEEFWRLTRVASAGSDLSVMSRTEKNTNGRTACCDSMCYRHRKRRDWNGTNGGVNKRGV